MSPLTLLEELDVLRELALSLLTGLVATMMHQLTSRKCTGNLCVEADA